jgi:hypothetical protein
MLKRKMSRHETESTKRGPRYTQPHSQVPVIDGLNTYSSMKSPQNKEALSTGEFKRMIDGYKISNIPNSQSITSKKIRPKMNSEDFGPNFDPRNSNMMTGSMGKAILRNTKVEEVINYYKCAGEN